LLWVVVVVVEEEKKKMSITLKPTSSFEV